MYVHRITNAWSMRPSAWKWPAVERHRAGSRRRATRAATIIARPDEQRRADARRGRTPTTTSRAASDISQSNAAERQREADERQHRRRERALATRARRRGRCGSGSSSRRRDHRRSSSAGTTKIARYSDRARGEERRLTGTRLHRDGVRVRPAVVDPRPHVLGPHEQRDAGSRPAARPRGDRLAERRIAASQRAFAA